MKDVVIIKENSIEYKIWLKKRNEKNLDIRTQKKLARKARATKTIEHNYNLNLSKFNNKQNSEVSFIAPKQFSFITNLEETTTFFNDIISFISDDTNFGENIFIDLSKITDYTTDALMYLIAMLNNLNEHFKGKYRFWGNVPMDSRIKKKFRESGFFRYVHYEGKLPLSSSTDNIKIVSGDNSNPIISKQISDFIAEKANISVFDCRFIYIMLIELMSNTNKHAYNDTNVLSPHWYCFVEYDNNIITVTFMDTGTGIPSTVRKNFSEKLDILKIKGEDKYVISALNGDFRTSTYKSYRGKGLPKIREICSKEKIFNMRIITNKADVVVKKDGYNSCVINKPFIGTLYNWQINITDLKGA